MRPSFFFAGPPTWTGNNLQENSGHWDFIVVLLFFLKPARAASSWEANSSSCISPKAQFHTTHAFSSGKLAIKAAIRQASGQCIQCCAYNAMWDAASSGKHHCQTVRFVCFILSRCLRVLKINYKSKQHDSLSTEQVVLPSFCTMHPMQCSRQTFILMAIKKIIIIMHLHNEIAR